MYSNKASTLASSLVWLCLACLHTCEYTVCLFCVANAAADDAYTTVCSASKVTASHRERVR